MSRRSKTPSDYDHYVDHPRFGREPRRTGLDPRNGQGNTHLHWINGPFVHGPQPEKLVTRFWYDDGGRTVESTAIVANQSRQSRATIPVTHYFDLDKVCRDCGHRFLFFAEEQRHWYEELQLPLEADCVRCVPCRKQEQRMATLRRRYQELIEQESSGSTEVECTLELCDVYLTLVEERDFSSKRLDRVRRRLKRLPEAVREGEVANGLLRRVEAIERIDGD